jgi:hypothetical protein
VAGFLLASQAAAGIDARLRHRYPGAAGSLSASSGGLRQCLLPRAAGHRRTACAWHARTLQMGISDWRGTCHDDSGEGKLAKLCVPCAGHVAHCTRVGDAQLDGDTGGVNRERARAAATPL